MSWAASAGPSLRATGIDAMWVRIGFVLLAIASGVMVFVYAMAWLLIPMEGEDANIASRLPPGTGEASGRLPPS